MNLCPHCRRLNPSAALFCHHDGSPLATRANAPSRHRFVAPFIFPTGRAACTFDELALACLDEWPAAVDLLRTGAFSAFLRAAGRADLAERAHEASLFPDADWGLAQLLERLPTRNIPDARLAVPVTEFDLGFMRVGQDLSRPLVIENTGRGCLHGTITSDVPWLTVSRPRFACHDETTIEILIRGRNLRAAVAPLVGRLSVQTSGGWAVVTVRATVPVNTFAAGVLAGARTPRQLVEKARAAPQEAARLFESGAVARWYESNGWIYPVKGNPPAGTATIRLFFTALGLPAPAVTTPVPATRAQPDDAPLSWLPQEAPTTPHSVLETVPDWTPVTRSKRKHRPTSPCLTPVKRRPSYGWLLFLLPVALLLLMAVVSVVIVFLPARQHIMISVHVPERPAPVKVVKEKKHPVIPSQPKPPPNEEPTQPKPSVPLAVPEFTPREVEVVFCLDTTGSMGSLLKGVQAKVWSMCNQVAAGKPTPSIKVGLVAYRDRGDDYVSQVTDLSRDLDAVHQRLLGLSAGGGGDVPESVNQAIDDAVNKITWSTDKKTLKIVFLVGDAPPHMDYTDDVKYPDTCKKATEKGIIINAIQCGDDADCTKAWKDIADKAKGAYVAIPQTGGVRVVTTPLDDKLAKLLSELLDTALIYGKKWQKTAGERMLLTAGALKGPSAADRAAFAARSKKISPYDLLDAINERRVKLDDVVLDELPAALAGLKTVDDRRAHLKKIAEKRTTLQAAILDLEKKRAEHLQKNAAANKDAFDVQVLEILRKQAKEFDVEY